MGQRVVMFIANLIKTFHSNFRLNRIEVLQFLVLPSYHVPLRCELEGVVEPGQQVEAVFHSGHVTDTAGGR